MKNVNVLGKIACAAAALAVTAGGALAADGDARVEKWPDGRKAALLLQFDDGCPSQLNNAIPELKKRGWVGTFYINAGCGHCSGNIKRWEKEVPEARQVLGNHTFTHKGANNAAELDTDLGKAQEVIKKIMKYDRPHLVAFGQPGGVPWKVSKEEKAELFKKYNLVERPPFWGATIHLKNLNDYAKIATDAIKKGEMGHIDFHGTGGDWLGPKNKEEFVSILDKLAEFDKDLWFTDMISWHQYKTEREGAKVHAAADGRNVKVTLECKTDAALYSLPLEISIATPKGWTACKAVQNGREIPAEIRDGRAFLKAAPVSGDISVSSK